MFSPFPWDKEGQLNCRIIICQNYLTYIGTSENQQHDHEYKWRVIHCIFVWVCMYDDMAQEAQIPKKKDDLCSNLKKHE